MTDFHDRSANPVPSIRVTSADGILAVIPHLVGFHPSNSIVVAGLGGRPARFGLTCRYDLPGHPDAGQAAQIAAHAVRALRAQPQLTGCVIAGYGPGDRVTPVTDALSRALRTARIGVRDILRVQDGRYWSCLCQDPGCCPPEGTAFDQAGHPAAAALASAGMRARADRAALARTLDPLPGSAPGMRQAWERALRRARTLIDEALGPATGAPGPPAEADGPGPLLAHCGDPDALRLVIRSGRRAVRTAIGVYRGGGEISDHDRLAWLGLALTDLRVRDDAWARMAPEFRDAHQRLWTCLVRRLPPAHVAPAAALLAFTAWQGGDGALASMAIDRALAADPEYSMALLISRAIDAAIPPSAAWPPLTPRQVAASYRRGAASAGAAGRRGSRHTPA